MTLLFWRGKLVCITFGHESHNEAVGIIVNHFNVVDDPKQSGVIYSSDNLFKREVW